MDPESAENQAKRDAERVAMAMAPPREASKDADYADEDQGW
jgi:hypothetical protein